MTDTIPSQKPVLRIAVAPTKVKVTAAQIAAARLRSEGHDVQIIEITQKAGSGVPEQPIGLDEAHRGARTRADSASLHGRLEGATHGLGIENCFAYVGSKVWLDIAMVVLVDHDGNEVVTSSTGIPSPATFIGRAIDADHNLTAGSFMAQAFECDGANWHSVVVGPEMDRVKILADAAYAAMKIWLNAA